jgi:hypothetical protein
MRRKSNWTVDHERDYRKHEMEIDLMRMRTIKLAHGVEPTLITEKKSYKVLVVKNSTDYSPGQVLTHEEVDDLCRISTWDVTIVSLTQEGAR